MTSLAMNLLERDLVPDFLIRRRIRSLLASRLREEDQRDPERQQQRFSEFLRGLTRGPVAIETEAANQQHYEVPTEFYQRVLGRHLKYSSGYFGDCILDEPRLTGQYTAHEQPDCPALPR